MKQIHLIVIFLIFTIISCKIDLTNNSALIKVKPEFKDITYKQDSLILFEILSTNGHERTGRSIDYRGVDSYSCTFDSIDGLRITMSFGLFPGQSIIFNVKEDSVKAEHSSWGCTSYADFQFITTRQNIILNSNKFATIDTIIGFIHYEAIRDIEQKIEEWESYGQNSDWINELEPLTTKIEGYFKFKIHKDFNEFSDEFNRYDLFRKREFDKYLERFASAESDSFNAYNIFLKELPVGIEKLTSIEKLNLEANDLIKEDFSILNPLKNLSRIYLGWNGFTQFPKNLLTNRNLKYINLKGNPIESIPIQDLINSNVRYINLEGCKLDNSDIQKLKTRMTVEN